MAKRLRDLCADLHISEITSDPQIQMNLEEDERAIQELAQSCSETAKNLIAERVHWKIDPYQQKSGKIRKTFKGIRVSSKIKDSDATKTAPRNLGNARHRQSEVRTYSPSVIGGIIQVQLTTTGQTTT